MDRPLKSNQFRATFLKSATFLKRQKGALCLQISIPLILVIILSVIQIFIKHQIAEMQPTLIPPKYVDVATFGYFMDANPNGIDGIGSLSSSGGGTGLLGNIPQYELVENNTFFPYAQSFDTMDDMMKAVLEIKDELVSERRSSFKIQDIFRIPFSAVAFNNYSKSNAYLDYQVNIETQPIFQYSNVSDPALYMFTMNLLETAFLKTVYGLEFLVDANIYEMPYLQEQPRIDVGSLLGGLFYPFALSFLLPLFVYSIVLEKQEKLRDMCLMAGLKMRNYYAVTYIFNFMLYVMAVIIVVGISVLFQFSVFTQGSPLAMALLLFGWGNAMITFSFFLSTLFKKTRTATVTCYLLVIVSVIVNLVLGAQLFQTTSPPAPYYWYPPFAFARGLSLISFFCGLDMCPQWSDFNWQFEPSRIIFWLYIDSIFFMILAIYLDQVLPREFGVPKKPWFIFNPIIRLFKSSNKTPYSSDDDDQDQYNESTHLINDKKNEKDDEEAEEEDEDVKQERLKIQNHQYNHSAPVIIENLSKKYEGREKYALDGLYLTIDYGECCGLLGPNGAGKSSTINLLTGLYRPTKGRAKVGGYDLATQMDDIHRIVGVCPQFDILWQDLSCMETLLFYARLKGVPINEEQYHVESILDNVELLPFKDRLVKELSGGMRRRLSLATSIVGYSKVILLDEPTTGLDANTRRSLWKILNRLKEGRCIILTSHMLDEVDVLSNKVAILSQGKLKVIGSQQHLKSKFGQGYSLKISVDEKFVNQVDVLSLIREFSSGASLVERYSGNYTIRLPKDISISSLFVFIESIKTLNHFTHWAINQTSLEDVFLKIGSEDDTVN